MATETIEGTDVPRPTTLDDLETLTRSALDAVFDRGTAPEVEELDGRYRGRVLTGPAFPLSEVGVATRLTNALVNNPTNPWAGKRFEPLGEMRGEGVNLLSFGPIEREVLAFDYHRASSTVGHDDCIFLDYDVPENPPGARRIRDELKRVADGLYLGRLYLEGDDRHFVLYWALAE